MVVVDLKSLLRVDATLLRCCHVVFQISTKSCITLFKKNGNKEQVNQVLNNLLWETSIVQFSFGSL